jgi:hypothetical protein
MLLRFIPHGWTVLKPYYDFWNAVVPWVGTHLFQAEIAVHLSGSGDMTYNYVQLFCTLVLAAAAAAVWTLLDRKRADYGRLHDGLRVGARYALAAAMILYGAVKVIKSQFAEPSLHQLVQPLGEKTPMGLLWTFMGASTSYTVFTGVIEMLGGILLTVRRTTLLGALVCAGFLANVVMLNVSYDVPVKLYSSHLLALSVFLIAPDARRLANFWLLNRPVGPASIRPLFGRKWLDRGAVALRTLLVGGFVTLALVESYKVSKAYGDLAPRSPLHGIWKVEEFAADGQVRPPLATDAARWRRVIFDGPSVAGIQMMNESSWYYSVRIDTERNTVSLQRRGGPKEKAELSYQRPEPGLLVVEGRFAGRQVRVKLRRQNESEFRLLGRGFHWINEYPYNR